MIARNRRWDTVVTAIATLLIVLALGWAGTSHVKADQPTSPPGQGECDHGNSQQSCKPDPQPSNGQDCDEHGPKEGGVNEDHCLGGSPSPTTTPSPSSAPSASPTAEPSAAPSSEPTPTPSSEPSASPSPLPSSAPSLTPTSPPNSASPTGPPTDIE